MTGPEKQRFLHTIQSNKENVRDVQGWADDFIYLTPVDGITISIQGQNLGLLAGSPSIPVEGNDTFINSNTARVLFSKRPLTGSSVQVTNQVGVSLQLAGVSSAKVSQVGISHAAFLALGPIAPVAGHIWIVIGAHVRMVADGTVGARQTGILHNVNKTIVGDTSQNPALAWVTAIANATADSIFEINGSGNGVRYLAGQRVIVTEFDSLTFIDNGVNGAGDLITVYLEVIDLAVSQVTA